MAQVQLKALSKVFEGGIQAVQDSNASAWCHPNKRETMANKMEAVRDEVVAGHWAEIYDKTCLWCGKKQHLGGEFCRHPFYQTWDKDHTDCAHFEKWLSLQIPPE